MSSYLPTPCRETKKVYFWAHGWQSIIAEEALSHDDNKCKENTEFGKWKWVGAVSHTACSAWLWNNARYNKKNYIKGFHLLVLPHFLVVRHGRSRSITLHMKLQIKWIQLDFFTCLILQSYLKKRNQLNKKGTMLKMQLLTFTERWMPVRVKQGKRF